MFADKTTRQARMQVCKACPNNRKGIICALCSCAIVLKILGRGASCPAGKW